MVSHAIVLRVPSSRVAVRPLPEMSTLWVVLVTLLALLVEYAGVMGPLVGASRRYDGPMGKSDRAFVFGVLGAGVASGLLPLAWLDPLLALVAVLLAWTLANRVRQGIAEAARRPPSA